MKIIFTLTLTILTSINVLGQNFEGKITYQNSFKSKLPNVTSEQFNSMMGTRQEYYFKGGDYKSVANGTLMHWQLYINKDNKLYNKLSNSETILWNDGSVNSDSIISVEQNKGVIEILGYKCDEIILTCKSGIQKYYFNSKISVDPRLFSNHKYGNWSELIRHSKALPLKMVIENPQFTMEGVALEVKPMKLDKKEFELPENAKTSKSTY